MFSSERTPQLSQTTSKVQWPLRFDFSYVQPVTQRYRQKNSKRSPSATIQSPRKYDSRAPNYQLLPRKCSGCITLRFQLCSARCTALQTKNSVRIISAISPVSPQDDSRLQTYCMEAMHRASANQHLWLSAKRNGTQRRTKVSVNPLFDSLTFLNSVSAHSHPCLLLRCHLSNK